MLEVGAVLGGRYTLERLLGHGGFGEVYLARDGKLGGKRVAVKVLHGPALRSPILRAKLLEEATTAAQLGGHHVVQVSDAGDDPQAGPYLVMEYLEGTTLEDHLREVGGRLSPASVWDIFDQLQQGLSEAHQRGVVHRDLKPANVFLAKAGKGKVVVKLLDFGLAKVLAEGESAEASRVGGTAAYMAPEQVTSGAKIGPETDVWALGLMAFQMLTGRHYWRTLNKATSPTPMEVGVEVLTAAIEPASVRASSLGASGLLPTGFDGWFSQCVARERSLRFSDASACIDALEKVLVGATPGASVASSVPADPPPSGGLSPRMETGRGFESFELPKQEAAPPPPVLPTEPAPSPPKPAPAPAPTPKPKPEVEPVPAPPMRRTEWAVPGVLGVGVLLGLGVWAFRSSPTRVDGGAQASGSASMTVPTDTAPATTPAPAQPSAPAPPPAAVVAMLSCPEGMLPVEGRSREGVDYRFCMDRTEVTVAAYRACPSCSAPDTGEYCNWNRRGRDDHPVNCVDARQADTYCASRGGRLPTEQEWQFAAQGPDGRTYPWGEEAPSNQLCWSGVNARGVPGANGGTCTVGSFPTGRSPFGLEDMSGNVWEWTSSSEVSDRVVRGGGWVSNDPARVRAARRNRSAVTNRVSFVGFRCARGAP